MLMGLHADVMLTKQLEQFQAGSGVFEEEGYYTWSTDVKDF
jgi:hypothetical protein